MHRSGLGGAEDGGPRRRAWQGGDGVPAALIDKIFSAPSGPSIQESPLLKPHFSEEGPILYCRFGRLCRIGVLTGERARYG